MRPRWLVHVSLVVALIALTGFVVRTARRHAAAEAASQPPVTAPAAHAHGAHGGGAIDWGNVTSHDLDVASIFLTARDSGVARALDRLRAFAARDPAFRGNGHVVAHALGRFAVTHAGGDPSVYAQCREDFQAGCWHGVMEGYFTSARARPDSAVAGPALDRLCSSIVAPGRALLPRLECAHGMGHGLTARANNDWRAALRGCDALGAADARRECHDGVFMEVTVRGTEPRPGTNDGALLRRTDLRWPCDSVASAHRASCWAYQPIVIYDFTRDLSRTVAECARLTGADAEACHRGLGKQLVGWVGDDRRLVATCRRGDARYVGACIAGAAEGHVDDTWTAARAIALCRAAPNGAKPACYGMVGARMKLIHPTDEELARDCAGAEPAFVATCRAAVRRDAGAPTT